MEQILQIQEFKLEQMVVDPAILVIGKRATGKTVLCDNILDHLINKYDCNVSIVHRPERINPYYRPLYPDADIYYDLDDVVLSKILDTAQLDAMRKTGKHNVLVMEDCLAVNKDLEKKDLFIELVFNNHSYRIPYILTMQYPMVIMPAWRCNLDYIFLTKEGSAVTKKKIWDQYASEFSTFESFEKIFTTITRDYGIMVIDNRKHGGKMEERVFWFKAKIRNDRNELELWKPRIESRSLIDLDTIYSDLSDDELYTDDEITTCNQPALERQGEITTCNQANTVKFETDLDTDQFFDYFIDNPSCCSPTISPSITPINSPRPIRKQAVELDNNDQIQIKYHNDNYDLSFTTDKFNTNNTTITSVLNHIVVMNNLKLNYMSLLNENMRLQTKLNEPRAYDVRIE